VDAILFPEVDRETRNPVISIPILNQALGAGVPVFFAEEQLRLDPEDSEAIQRYTDAMAKSCAYLATMVQKCRAGRFDRAEQDHKLPCNTRMFGFDIVDGRRVPNQAQAEALREAARIALKEGRVAPAVKWLNEKGWSTMQKKLFTRVTLRKLFRNRALIGETTIEFREKTVVLHHEPILDAATFEALQLMLDEIALRAPRAEVFYALSGLLYCGSGERFDPTKTGDNRNCYEKHRFEPTKAGTNRYYYRCEKHCGEKAWHKDDLEWEVYQAFSRYLQHRESQKEYLELAQKSRAKLEKDRAQVERDITENNREWKILLEKELADYPSIIIDDKKRELSTERESLLQAKAKIKAQLDALPQVNLAEVEVALDELAKPWQRCNTGGYGIPHPMSWERASVAEAIDAQRVGDKKRSAKLLALAVGTLRKLTDEQAHLLREMLLKLNCRIAIRNRAVFISGSLPLAGVRVNETTSQTLSPSQTLLKWSVKDKPV